MSGPAWYERFGQIGKRLSVGQRYYERGLFYYEKGKLDLALADLDEAIQHEPKKAEYYVTRGLILLQSQRSEEAEEDFAYGLKLDPAQWLAHYGRGIYAFEQSNYEQAIDYFSRAQLVAPKRPEVYLYRAAAFYLAGQPDEAVRDMTFTQSLLGSEDKRRREVTKWLNLFKK
jgi:tetratricopeptide (TPR) repeat protein